MRKILWVVGVLALGWSGYWLWSAHSLQREITGWLSDRRDEGWQAEAAEVRVAGYPLRFETLLSELALADPDTGLAWQAPTLALSQTAWQPNAVTVIWPDVHVLRTPDETLTLRNDALTADVATGATAALPLERAALRAATLSIEHDGGGVTSLADLSAEILRGEDTTYAVTLLAEGVLLPARFLRSLGADLPQGLERAEIDLRARFDRPWDLRAIDTARPQPTALDLRVLEATWGPMALRMSADLEIDPDGRPTGSVAIQAQNWRDMLSVAEQGGVLPPGVARALGDGLNFLAGLSGNPASLDVDLRLANGQIFVGPIPIGTAPRLRLR